MSSPLFKTVVQSGSNLAGTKQGNGTLVSLIFGHVILSFHDQALSIKKCLVDILMLVGLTVAPFVPSHFYLPDSYPT
jgi:formate hydrogenlyase subunit 3/multisubunit Na+/H+ antiporter MnhD subunit